MTTRPAGDLGFLKQHNRASLLELLRQTPGLTRAELAQRSKLTKVTVGAAVQELLEHGWLWEGAPIRGGSGRPGKALSLHPGHHAVLGLEIGVHGLHALAIDLSGAILAQRHQRFSPSQPDTTLDTLAEMVRELIDDALGTRQLLGVGLAVPGPTSPQQHRLSLAPNLGWRDLPLLDMLKQRLPGLAGIWTMDNEAKAAAFGELYLARSSTTDETPASLLYVSAGTGIGSGLVEDGSPPRVIRGVHGAGRGNWTHGIGTGWQGLPLRQPRLRGDPGVGLGAARPAGHRRPYRASPGHRPASRPGNGGGLP